MTSFFRRSLLTLACAFALGIPTLAHAALEFTPVIGVLHPVKAEYADFGRPLVFSYSSATAYGARLAWWVSPRIGLEASALTGGATFRLTAAGAIEGNGTLFQGDGRVRLRLNPAAATNHFDLIVGGGISDAQSDLTDFLNRSGFKRKAQTEWLVGAGATLGLWQNAALRIDFEDHFHPQHIEIDETVFGSQPNETSQQDLTWTVGVVIPIGKR